MHTDILLLTKIIELTPIGIVVMRTDGRVYYLNACASKMFNISASLLEGKPIHSYVSEINGERSWEEIFELMLKQEISKTSVIIHSHEKEDIICELSSFFVPGNNDYPDSLALIFRNITQQTRIDEQIEIKNLEMAKMNSELIRSNAELKRVSEMKSNFLSIASHELKTPLTSIKGYSDIIIDNMKEKIDSGVYRMIESINRAADRLHRVVNNILDVTRIEKKRLRLKPEMIDLGAVAKDCIDELSQFSLKRGITFSCVFENTELQFYGDKMKMQQVFTNLFSNSLKYSPDGSAVEVSIGKQQNEERFHIVVKDHGIGIDKNEQKHIFDAFYEVGSATRHSTDFSKFMGGGTGLGLSIVKGIIERHGGKIWVESEGVKENSFPGSEFHITLPFKAEISWDDDETKFSALEKEDEPNEQETSLQTEVKPTILFIDSDREAVEIARMVLENAFETVVAESGEMGLSLAFQHRPSLILMDSYLPGIDGYRVCRILRSQEETRDIPVAFFSAGTQKDEIQKCFASGADDFIVKPFSGRELVDKIWRLLMKKKEEETYK